MDWVEKPIRTFHLMHMENSFKKGTVNPPEDVELIESLHANVGWFTATGCAAGLGNFEGRSME